MQTEYTINMAAGRLGAIADSAMVQDIESHKNPTAEVKFGHVVTKGAADGDVIHPDAAAKVTDEKLVRGIVVASHEIESRAASTGLPGYPQYSVVPVMRKGRIWVRAEDTITEGTSTVNARVAANGGNTQLGGLRGAADSTFSAVLPKSKWKTSTSGAGQLAILEIDL